MSESYELISAIVREEEKTPETNKVIDMASTPKPALKESKQTKSENASASFLIFCIEISNSKAQKETHP